MKLTTIGKIAFCEYEPVNNPEFQLDEKGYLMVFGYSTFFAGKQIGCAKGFDLKSDKYEILGKYDVAKETIIGIDKLITDFNLDRENCLFLKVN